MKDEFKDWSDAAIKDFDKHEHTHTIEFNFGKPDPEKIKKVWDKLFKEKGIKIDKREKWQMKK